MAENSKIEWTDSTFNPWVGCTKIARRKGSPSACDFCYAESWAKRSGQVKWGDYPRRRTTSSYWRAPLGWNAQASGFQGLHGRRQRVFCASLADVFDNQIDPQWRVDLFALIRQCDQLDWQLLTKRPQNIRKMLPDDWGNGYPNVWLGTTTEDAEAYRQRASYLLKVPAVVHFISYEPAIGPLGSLNIEGLVPDWVIIGGESGVRADKTRPTDPQWVRAAITECRQVGAAPFLKQWGRYSNNPHVVEHKLAARDAMRFDPPENGKGGGMLEYPLGDDGLVVERVGRWAKTKHKLLRDYIQASSGARAKHYSGRAYIDVFCGPGRLLVRDSNEYIEGSPIAAFEQARASHAAFSSIEISDLNVERCNAATARLKVLGAPVAPTSGPAVNAMREIVSRLDAGGLHFAFLDPHNLGALLFELLKMLARLERVDIIVHVSIADLRRNADRYTSEAHKQFDAFAPGWRDAIDYRNMNSATLRSKILAYWSDQVTKLGLTRAAHSEQIRAPGNQQLYFLSLLSRSDLALTLWKAVSSAAKEPVML